MVVTSFSCALPKGQQFMDGLIALWSSIYLVALWPQLSDELKKNYYFVYYPALFHCPDGNNVLF